MSSGNTNDSLACGIRILGRIKEGMTKEIIPVGLSYYICIRLRKRNSAKVVPYFAGCFVASCFGVSSKQKKQTNKL